MISSCLPALWCSDTFDKALVEWHKHSIDMHVKLVSCFALCWKLPLWTVSLELDTQSNRFGIMWLSTMILPMLPFGVIEWGNIRHIGSQGTFNSTCFPPSWDLRATHCCHHHPVSATFQGLKLSVFKQNTTQNTTIGTSIHQKIVRHIAFVTRSSKAVHPKFVQLLPDFELLYSVFACFYFCKGVVFVLILYSCQNLLNDATQDQELPLLTASQPQKSRARHGMAK